MELRRFNRAPIHQSVLFAKKGDDAYVEGVGRDISLGGMFVETDVPCAFGDEVLIHVTLPGQKAEFTLPGIVRWTRADGMGIQFGMLGARETYAITEIVRAHESAR